jgi:uncharacterized SAM-binding protein YcdF (DUF218 family)
VTSSLAKHRFWKYLLASLAPFCCLLAACWAFRAPLLTAIAKAWVVNDPLQKADAIIILGGRPGLRAPAAARLFHEGIAPRIVYMDVKHPEPELGPTLSEGEVTHRLLLSNNVPETALTMLGANIATTYDESCNVRAWLASNSAKCILIPTDLSHTRRARWIFRRQLKGAHTEVRILALVPGSYGITNWWLNESGLIAFQNEWMKSIFYHFKY